MRIRALGGFAALALAAATVTALPALQASASPTVRAGQVKLTAPASGGGAGQNLSSVVSSSWQTNNPVWSIVAANGDVFVGGQFTSVRPPGDPLGTGEVARQYLAEFNASTGALITSFDPTFTLAAACPAPGPSTGPCGITALAVSPNGSILYVGGTFTTADGSGRSHLAAFSTSTGALLSTWNPKAGDTVLSISVSPDGSSIYMGGDFGKLGTTARKYAGAVNASGTVLPWAPVVNGIVTSVAVATDDSRVLIGGDFTTFNGVTQQSIGSTDPTTGASDAWALPSNFVPNYPGCLSDVKDVVISGTVAYVAGEGTGGGCFDGDFAVNVSDGSLVWQSACLGATQSIAVVNGWLYKGSHAHDCAYAPGGFPQVDTSGGDVLHHLLDQSLTDGSIGFWTPSTNDIELGPRVMATDGTQLFVGGGFTTVNNLPQQGFARFAPTPDTTAPGKPAAPTVASTSAGVVSVTFSAVSDSDDGTLTYTLYRNGGTTPIATLHATSWPWAEPVLHYRDSGLTPGSTVYYSVTASDGTNTTLRSTSAKIVVSSTSPSLSYYNTVLGDSPSFFWPLNDASGSSTAADMSGNGNTGSYETGATPGAVPGPVTGSGDTAPSFDGNAGLVTSTNSQTMSASQAFSVEGWFKTSANTGGKLIGFGNAQTGASSNYDRHIYMMNDGQLVFGVWNNQTETIETPKVYNDGQWHYVVATFDPTAGMALYVDNQLIGTNSNTAAQPYTGYWRVGGDNLNGWNLDPWGSNSQGTTEPISYYFNGDIADVAVYPVALSAAQVAAHYAANALSH